MAENSFSVSAGPSFGPAANVSRGYYQATIVNQSNHNCTGGIISLRAVSGDFQQLPVGSIPIGGQQSFTFSLNSDPSLLTWDLSSDVGQHWGPGGAVVSAASFPATLPLQPF